MENPKYLKLTSNKRSGKKNSLRKSFSLILYLSIILIVIALIKFFYL